MRASELLLIVRAQNQASAALRRIAGDMKGLSAVGGLRQRGQSLQIARRQLDIQRMIAQNELNSINNGARKIAQEKALLSHSLTTQRAKLSETNVGRQLLGNQAQQIRKQEEINRLTRATAKKQIPVVRARDLALLEAAGKEMQALTIKEGMLAEQAGVAAGAITNQALALKKLEAAEIDAAGRAGVLNARLANLGDRYKLNTQKILDNNRAINDARWDRVSAGGRMLQHTARIMQYAGLVLGGTLAVMANNAAKFDTSVTLAATQTRKAGQSFTVTAANSKVLQRDIMSLMKEFPASADDFSKAAYDIYSSTSVSFAGGRKALKLFAQAAVAGMTDVQTATDMGITVLNNFSGGIADLPNKMQTAFAAVRFGRMTFDQFAKSMSTIAPAARAANQNFTDMAGTFAFLTRHLDVAKSRVGFARVLEALTQPKMLKGLKEAGITIESANHRLQPLDVILGKIIKRFPGLRDGGTDAMNFFKNIGGLQSTMQARRAFTFLVQFFDKASKDGMSYKQMLAAVKGDNVEFTASLQAMEQTAGVRWGVFVNQLKSLALAIGQSVIPALMALAGPLEKMVSAWENLDESTKNQIGRWATYTAAFLLLGGALTFVGGTIVRLFTFLGRFIGFLPGAAATVIILATAIGVLKGDIRSLNDVLDMILDFSFDSWAGAAITIGVVTASVVKLTGALRGLAGAEAVSGAGGLAGILGRGGGAAKGLKELYQVRRLEGAGRVASGIAASAAMMSSSFLVTGGAVAAIVGGMYIWKRHMDAVEASAKRTRDEMSRAAAPRRELDVFQGLIGSVEDMERAKINIRQIQREIAATKQQMRGTTGAGRAALLDQLKTQTMDLADAQKVYSDAIDKSNFRFNAYTRSLEKVGLTARRVNQLQNQLNDAIREDQRQPPGLRGKGVMGERIEGLRRSLAIATRELQGFSENSRRIVENTVKGLARIGQFKMPKMGTIKDIAAISQRMGRMLSIPEMKAVIKAEIDPAARRNLPAAIRRIFDQVRKQRIHLEIDQKEQAKAAANFKKVQKAVPKAFKFPAFTIPDATPKAKTAQQKIAKVFKPITQHVIVKPPGNLAQIGASIVSGIQAGVDQAGAVSVQKVVIESIKKQVETGSPSRWAMREVGKPITQGIAIGILQARGDIVKAAQITMDLFQGTILSKLDEKKKPTGKLLIKDLQSQLAEYRKFNSALARLARRGAPKELIDQLAALGPEAAGKIAMLSKMSAPQLRRYIALWKAAQREIKKSQRATQEEIKAAQKQFMDDLVSQIQQMFDQIHSEIEGQFGGIFEGITALSGKEFQDAMKDYNSQIKDFQNQISDLNQQIVDAHKEATQRLVDAINARKQELQQAMGDLFQGDWMKGENVQTRLEWGKKLGFDDLFKDLQSQVTKFAHWRDALTQIAAQVPPELAAQLEALGPDAVDQLDILNNATDEQLAQYVALWQQGQQQIQAVANQTTVDTSDITARIADLVSQIADVMQRMSEIEVPHELTAQDIIDNIKKQQDQWLLYEATLQSLIDKNLPPELIDQLAKLGPEALPYLLALNSMNKEQLAELVTTWQENHQLIEDATLRSLNRQLDMWFQYGKNAALNIIAGVSSESQALRQYFTKLILSLMNNTPPPAPPKPTDNTGAIHIQPTGVNFGGYDPWVSRAFTPYGPTGTTVNFNQTVNAQQSETLDTTLARASFRFRTTVPG